MALWKVSFKSIYPSNSRCLHYLRKALGSLGIVFCGGQTVTQEGQLGQILDLKVQQVR